MLSRFGCNENLEHKYRDTNADNLKVVLST